MVAIKILRRDDIVGTKIIKADQSFKLVDDWLDSIATWFTNDRGYSFQFPSSGDTWRESTVPSDAKPLIGRDSTTILDHVITGVFVDPNGDPAETVIQLDDGRCLSELATSPHGVGASRLYIRTTEQSDFSGKQDFWKPSTRVPLDRRLA